MSAEERTSHHRDHVANKRALIDGLAMGLANGTLSRGQALKYAGAALLGGALGIFGFASPADARRRRRRSSCMPCNSDDPNTIPVGSCCLVPFGMIRGCAISQESCRDVCVVRQLLPCNCICRFP